MKPRQLIGVAAVPGGEQLRLFRRGDDFMMVLGNNELMNSRMSGSEIALAELTCARISSRAQPRVLIGGYGMGFTLRAALGVLPLAASVIAAELVPEVIDWARGPMAELTAGCLNDPRVKIIKDDVAAVIARSRSSYDAILLDVDNGPEGLTRSQNDRLYSGGGLATLKAALKPGGILAVWSAAPDAAFARKLKTCGFAVDQIEARANTNGKGPRHTIWLAERL